MALTKVKTAGIDELAVTQGKLATDAVGLDQLAAGTDGKIITWDASGDPAAVGPGDDGQVLTSTGAGSPPTFEDVLALTGSTNNQITTVTGANAIQGEANLTFDGTTLKITDTELSEASDNFTINIQSGNNDCYIKSGGTTIAAFKGLNKHLEITDGDLVMGATGHGINFAASQTNAAGMTSETLDHYEEGTWTPGISFSGSGTGIVYDTSGADATGGKYTRIGNQVTVSGNIVLTSKGSVTGPARITGLPFTDGSTADAGRSSGSIGRIANFSTGSPMQLLTDDGASTIRIRRIEVDWDDSEDVNNNDFTDTTNLFFSMTYFA